MMARCLSLSLLTRTVAAFGMPAVKRARSTLVVAPADGQTFAVAGDSAEKITLLLDDVKANYGVERSFTPDMDGATREKLCNGWDKAVKRSLDWVDEEE